MWVMGIGEERDKGKEREEMDKSFSQEFFICATNLFSVPRRQSLEEGLGKSFYNTPSKPLWKTIEQVTDVATARRDLVG